MVLPELTGQVNQYTRGLLNPDEESSAHFVMSFNTLTRDLAVHSSRFRACCLRIAGLVLGGGDANVSISFCEADQYGSQVKYYVVLHCECTAIDLDIIDVVEDGG